MSKPRELGYRAQEDLDEALMAVSVLMKHAKTIMSNDLTKEGLIREVGLIISEGAEAQRVLTNIRYLGK